ncbi:ArsR family transcriptional regulator [Natrinema salinisoli]|uniref:ArsR family transcriptional regulator n=1 Tax=Natrinema salinisoli TaxID=2878535 RepID=UPI001CEFEA92|nr:ArsR family transcriptional regulator [Natrinema salinisoli]
MNEVAPFAGYNLVVGTIIALELLYFLSLEASVTAYRRFVLVTVGGLILAVVGAPIAELFAPSLVHWIHGTAALLVVLGLYDPVTNDVRMTEWSRVLLSDPNRIRRQPEWMTPMDDEILTVFHGSKLVLSPTVVAINTDYSRKEVNRRLLVLNEHDLLKKVERGKYRLTGRGEQYLRGEFQTGHTTNEPDGETDVLR